MKFQGSDTSSRPRRAQRCVLQIIGCLVVRRLHGSSEPVVVDGSAHHQQASGEKPVAQISAAVRRWANVSPARVPGACARSCGCDRDPPRAEIEARMRSSYTTTASPARHSKTTALTVQCWRADAYHETFVGGLLLTMANLYTMNGRPLTRRRDDLFTRSGNHIGHVQGERCSALTGDTSARLSAIVWVYRSTDSAHCHQRLDDRQVLPRARPTPPPPRSGERNLRSRTERRTSAVATRRV